MNLMASISFCMDKAIEEHPDSINWNAEQIWEKGSEWAGRNVFINVIEDIPACTVWWNEILKDLGKSSDQRCQK